MRENEHGTQGSEEQMLYTKPILLIEGAQATSPTIKEALDELGMTSNVVHVHDVERALERLSSRQHVEPAVIFLDGSTHGRDGLELLRTIKSDPRLGTIPVIVLAPSADARIVNESFALGAAGFVVKSLCREEFVEAVRAIHDYWTLSEVPVGA
jgi:CheY-like chemotaxis protein